MFAAIFIGLFDLQTNTLTFINRGNKSPLLLRKGCVVTALRPTGPVVGIIPSARFSVGELALEQNDLLLAFTDGLPDARDETKDSFGEERLLERLTRGDTSPATLLKQITEGLQQFIGAANQYDDITLLAVKRGS